MEEICIVIVQKLIYEVDKNRPSKLKKFSFDDHLKWHTLKFLVLIWSGIFEACLSVGLKIFDLSCEVFSPWKIKSKKWGEKMYKNQEKIRLKLKDCPSFNHRNHRLDLLVQFMFRNVYRSKILSLVRNHSKGLIISECLFDVWNFPKYNKTIWQISSLESKKWSNQQNKGTFL